MSTTGATKTSQVRKFSSCIVQNVQVQKMSKLLQTIEIQHLIF